MNLNIIASEIWVCCVWVYGFGFLGGVVGLEHGLVVKSGGGFGMSVTIGDFTVGAWGFN